MNHCASTVAAALGVDRWPVSVHVEDVLFGDSGAVINVDRPGEWGPGDERHVTRVSLSTRTVSGLSMSGVLSHGDVSLDVVDHEAQTTVRVVGPDLRLEVTAADWTVAVTTYVESREER